MPLETITLTIPNGNANPQTKTVQVNVSSATGTGSGSFTFTGVNSGVDSLTATSTIAGQALTSNVATVAWQACPSAVSIGPVTLNEYVNPGEHETWHGIGSLIAGPLTYNSVIINQVVNNVPILGIVSPDGNSGEYKLSPPHIDQVKSDGTALTTTGTTLPFNRLEVTVMQFKIVVKAAGQNTMYFLVDDAWALYVGGGVTRLGGSANSMILQPNGSSPAAPSTYTGLPLMATRNTQAVAIQTSDCVYLNFPAPGTYDAVIWSVNNQDNQAYIQPTFTAGHGALPPNSGNGVSGQVMLPVAIQAAPSPTVPSGKLQLSVANGNLHVVSNTVTINITVTGIVYSTEPYIPLLEGTLGKLFLYNSISTPTFTYPTYNGQPVDKTAAVTSGAIKLSGDNSSWVGRLLPAFNDGGDASFSVLYNGSGFDSHVDLTHLVVNSDDVSWFDSTGKTFDLFTITSGSGGLQLGITVDYMVSVPAASCTVTPNSVPADGGSHTFTLALPKPISPRQQGTQFGTGNTFTISGVSVGANAASSVTPILDAQGWLTGWNVTAVVTTSTSNGSLHITGTISGTLTRLTGTTFTTGTVTYATGNLGNAVTTVGVSFVAPTNYSFTPPASFSGSITLTATVFAKDNGSFSVFNFIRQLNGVNTTIGAGIKVSGPTAVSGGFTTTYHITVTSLFGWGTPIHFGYTATDALSGLSVTYISSTASTNLNSSGGGGGGGCPALEMFIDDWHQVSDVFVGMGVETLKGEYPEYLTTLATEPRNVEWFDFSTELCYRFVSKNGCEVVVSASTPVPTREAIEALAAGASEADVAIFASDIREGMHVITEIDEDKPGDEINWSELAVAECVGMRRVARLYCGGRNFAAGARPGRYIYTHNIICGK